MKTLFLPIVLFGIGATSAYADPGPLGTTMFTTHESHSERQAHPWHYAPKPQAEPSGTPTYIYTAPQNHGVWLYGPHENEGNNG